MAAASALAKDRSQWDSQGYGPSGGILNLVKTADYPSRQRRIGFKDPDSGKTLVFLTSNFTLPAATLSALYEAG